MADEKGQTREDIMKSQANYKGNDYLELVEIEITKDTDYYKKGDKDIVHPATAEIFKAKGLISGWKKYERPAVKIGE